MKRFSAIEIYLTYVVGENTSRDIDSHHGLVSTKRLCILATPS